MTTSDISSSPPLFHEQQPFYARTMKPVLVYCKKVPLIHILHSIILFLKIFFALANRDKRGLGKYREGGNNILQSKKREDMEEA